MELRSLPLMILLISNIHPEKTQERPKAVVIKVAAKYLKIIVRCEIPGTKDDWTYSWFRDGSSQPFSSNRDFSIKTDESDSSSNITCRGERSDGQLSEISDAVTLPASLFPETPKAVLKPEPSEIFRGETVTLTCDVQGEGWTYRWQCGDDIKHTSNEKELKITAEHTEMCRCIGCRGPVCSDWSDEVTLTVSDAYKAVLTVKPEPSQILRRENVTLTCDIQGEGWTYRWMCGGTHESKEKEFKITAEHTQMCRCYGCRGSVCSHWSDEETLTVSERPKPVLTVKPEPSQILRGENVTLTCDVQGEGWTYRWLCDGRDHPFNEKEFKITTECTQKCKCKGCRGSVCSYRSNEVTLTVSERPKAVLTVKPEPSQIVFGETVTLTCDVQGEGWTYRWLCDGRQDESKEKEFKITAERTQMCRCKGCRGSVCSYWSDEVTLTVSVSRSGQMSVLKILSFLLAACLYLLATVVMLYKCYRARDQ